MCGARFEHARQVRVEGRDRGHGAGRVAPREPCEQVDVSRDQCALGDDGDGIAELREHCETLTCDAEFSLDRLVRVRHPGERDAVTAGATTGKLHREAGPAIDFADGSKRWYRDGKLHREDGPAVECVFGDKVWYRDGVFIREERA